MPKEKRTDCFPVSVRPVPIRETNVPPLEGPLYGRIDMTLSSFLKKVVRKEKIEILGTGKKNRGVHNCKNFSENSIFRVGFYFSGQILQEILGKLEINRCISNGKLHFFDLSFHHPKKTGFRNLLKKIKNLINFKNILKKLKKN